MSIAGFRAAVFTVVQTWQTANQPGMFVAYENGPVVNERDAGDTFLDVELRFYGGSNVAIGNRSIGRDSGALALMAYSKRGEGTAVSDLVLGQLHGLLRNTRLAGGRLFYGQRSVPTDTLGWYRTGLLIPFSVDSA